MHSSSSARSGAPLRSLALIFVAVFSATSLVAAARIVSGPMLAWQEHREVLVWLETEGAEEAALLVTQEGLPAGATVVPRRILPSQSTLNPVGSIVHHFLVDALDAGQAYTYEIELDGALATVPEGSAPRRFSARGQWEWRADPPPVHFLIGSCNYHNDPPYDRPGNPYGQDAVIFQSMAKSGAQFMVWLGDNLYLREQDWTSRYGIHYRWHNDRANPALVPLLGAMFHYGTWDDHEFGPNDSSRSYQLKDVSLEAMNLYFPRQTSGELDVAGIYTRFKKSDAEFILLDGRYWRDDAAIDEKLLPGKSVLGARQMAWFKNALMESNRDSNTSVRFVAVGSQVLSPFPTAENFSLYPRERQEILDFIAHHRIRGVVFLTGDRHFAELCRIEVGDGVVVHDFTSSPLTAGPSQRPIREGDKWEEAANPLRVPGTLYADNNYGSVRVEGKRGERVLTLRLHDRTGAEIWTREHPLSTPRR